MVCPPVPLIIHWLKLIDYLSVEVDNKYLSWMYGVDRKIRNEGH